METSPPSRGGDDEVANAAMCRKRSPKAPLDGRTVRRLRQVVFAIVDFDDEHVIRPTLRQSLPSLCSASKIAQIGELLKRVISRAMDLGRRVAA